MMDVVPLITIVVPVGYKLQAVGCTVLCPVVVGTTMVAFPFAVTLGGGDTGLVVGPLTKSGMIVVTGPPGGDTMVVGPFSKSSKIVVTGPSGTGTMVIGPFSKSSKIVVAGPAGVGTTVGPLPKSSKIVVTGPSGTADVVTADGAVPSLLAEAILVFMLMISEPKTMNGMTISPIEAGQTEKEESVFGCGLHHKEKECRV